MPRMIIFRRDATPASVQIAVDNYNESYQPTLFPNSYRAVSDLVTTDNLGELTKNAIEMENRGVIGWQVDRGDIDSEDRKVVSGFDPTTGDSSDTTLAYYVNLSPGVVKLGSHSMKYAGAINANPLALCVDLNGDSAATRLLADGNSQKIRWFAVRLYQNATDSEVCTVAGIMGAEALTADVGTLDDAEGYPTDAEVETAFRKWQARVAGTQIFVDWLEFARQKLDRATTTITSTFLDLKSVDKAGPKIEYVDLEVDHADIAAAALSNTVSFNHINGLFVGATLQTLEASDLASLTVQLGTGGSANDLFDAFDVGTGGTNTLGLMATLRRDTAPFLAGDVLANYEPVATFTGGANLSTATAGTWRLRLYYIPVAANTQTNVLEGFFEENELDLDA